MRVPQKIRLVKMERSTLEGWSKGRTVAVRQAERAQIVLLAASGMSNQEIAATMAIKPHTLFSVSSVPLWSVHLVPTPLVPEVAHCR